MCEASENSLAANKQILEEKFLAAELTKQKMIGLIAAAENAERVYQILMKESGWTPEELFLQTGYRILLPDSAINH